MARQLFRTDSWTGDTDLVDIAPGHRLDGPPVGDPPASARPADDAGTGAGGSGTDGAGRYRYYEVDPATGAAKETTLGPNDQVVNVKPVGGKVTPGSGFFSGKGGAALRPAGDPHERVATHDSADGKWDVVDLPPKPAGFKNGNVTAHSKPAATSPRDGAYQVLRRDGSGNFDLLTYRRRPADVPPPDGAKGDGNQYHELGDGGRDGWHDGHPFGAGAPKVERIITGPGKRLDGKPAGSSDPDAVLVRDPRTGLYEKVESFASGSKAGEPEGRTYYRIGPDGRPQPIKVSGGKVDVVRVSPNDGKVTRTTFSVSGGDGTAKPYVNRDGSLAFSGPSEFSAGELRFDTDTGRITHGEQESAGFRGGGFDGGSGGPGGGGKGTATRPKTDGSRTQTHSGVRTFTDDGAASHGATSSKPAVKKNPSPTKGREADPSSERPNGTESADAFDRSNPGPVDGSGAGESGSVTRPGGEGSRTQTQSGVSSPTSSEGSGAATSAVKKDSFSGKGREVGSSSEHPDSAGRAEAFERLLGSKDPKPSPTSGGKKPGTVRPKDDAPSRGGSTKTDADNSEGTSSPPRGNETPASDAGARSHASFAAGSGTRGSPAVSTPRTGGPDSHQTVDASSSPRPRSATHDGREPAPRTGENSPSSAGDEPTLLPPGQDALVIVGRVLPTDNLILVEGEPRRMNPAEFTDWVRNQQGYEPGLPVVLLAGDARAFAPRVASLLGAPVTAPWGDFVAWPSGDLIAGRIEQGPDGAPQLIRENYDGWHTYGPYGQDTEVGPVLPDSESLVNSVVTAIEETGRAVATWRPPAEAGSGHPVVPSRSSAGSPSTGGPSTSQPARRINGFRGIVSGALRIDGENGSRSVSGALRIDGENGSRSVSGAVWIDGEFDPSSSTVSMNGHARDLEQLTLWIGKNTPYEPSHPLLLNVPGAGTRGPDGAPSFAERLAGRLGGRVLTPLEGPSGTRGWVEHRPPASAEGDRPRTWRLDEAGRFETPDRDAVRSAAGDRLRLGGRGRLRGGAPGDLRGGTRDAGSDRHADSPEDLGLLSGGQALAPAAEQVSAPADPLPATAQLPAADELSRPWRVSGTAGLDEHELQVLWHEVRKELERNHVRVAGDTAARLRERLPQLYLDLESSVRLPLRRAGVEIALDELKKGVLRAPGTKSGEENAEPGSPAEGPMSAQAAGGGERVEAAGPEPAGPEAPVTLPAVPRTADPITAGTTTNPADPPSTPAAAHPAPTRAPVPFARLDVQPAQVGEPAPVTEQGVEPALGEARASAQAGESVPVARQTIRLAEGGGSASAVTVPTAGSGRGQSGPATTLANLDVEPRGVSTAGPSGARGEKPAHPVSSRNTPSATVSDSVESRDDGLGGLADFNALVGRQEEIAQASHPVTVFGTRQDGARGLEVLAPVPQRTVEYLRRHLVRFVEESAAQQARSSPLPGAWPEDDTRSGAEPDARLRAEVERVLTSRLLSAEWSDLSSTSGMQLWVEYDGHREPVSLRYYLEYVGKADPQMELMPDGGPPVTLNRWGAGSVETDDTAAVSGLRPGSVAYTHSFDTEGVLRRVAVSPQINVAYNQAGSVVTTGATVQHLIIMRDKDSAFPHEYRPTWEFRLGDTTSELLAGRVPEDGWRAVEEPSPDNLVVWVPKYLSEAPRTLPTPNPNDPATVPAPVTRLMSELPLYGVLNIPDHDRLFADVMASFRGHLSDLSDGSRKMLKEFFGEGNFRSNLPSAWDGSVPSPILYTQSGSVIGYLKFSVEDFDAEDRITGPTTSNAVVETYLLRSLKMQGSSSVTNALGVNLPIPGFSFGGAPDPETGVAGIGGGPTFQAGMNHTFVHTLGWGGSARTVSSLRAVGRFFQVTPQARLRITLVRPAGAEVRPAAGTPLADARQRYPVTMLVPSLAALGHAPTRPRYLPAHLVHLRSLGVSTTPLRVGGTESLFIQLEQWLSEHGFLPPQSALREALDKGTERSVQDSRLSNKRKLDQARSRLGSLSALKESIQGGVDITFELPGISGVRRVTVKLMTVRRYTGQDANDGVEHYRTLPDVQTLNWIGSTLSREEQFTSVPLGWNAGVIGSVTNPFKSTESTQPLNRLAGGYTYGRQTAKVTGAGSGTGLEYYELSPSEDGLQLFRVPVTHRMMFSYSDGPAPEPAEADGFAELAVPTYRTLTEPSTDPDSGVVTVRDLTEEDINRLALPGDGHIYHGGVLRLPDTAVPDRMDGSQPLIEITQAMVDGLEDEAAELERAAGQAELPPMPGAWPRDDADTEPDLEAQVGAPAVTPWAGVLAGMAMSAVEAAGGLPWRGAASTWRFLRRLVVGEPTTEGESAVKRVIQMALSPHHLLAHAWRVVNGKYLIEGGPAAGAVAGTDITVEVKAYITNVRLLPQPPNLDLERWLQSTNTSMTADSLTEAHHLEATAAGQYGTASRFFDPAGAYKFDRSTTDGTVVNDNAGVWRITTEDTTRSHRLAGDLVFVVTVRRALSNVVVGTLRRGPALERTRVVEVPDGIEFKLVDNDLRNHPELLAIGDFPTLAEGRPRDRMLPSWYIDGGGAMGAGTVTEAHLHGGRDVYYDSVVAAVERQAPGVTRPGHPNYLPGVATQINEHTSFPGVPTLPNAGPHGHTAFHFVHRSAFFGPRLVEVTFFARPKPTADLTQVRGRLVDPTSGVDNVFGHSSGDGAALKVPGATGVSTTRTTSHEVDFAPVGQVNGGQIQPNLRLSDKTTITSAQTSSRELRAWRHTSNSAEFNEVPYVYGWTISSRPLNEALLVKLVAAGLRGLKSAPVWAGRATGVLDLLDPVLRHLPRPVSHATGLLPASVTLRFDADEAPVDGGHRAAPVMPSLYAFDPTATSGPAPGTHVVQIDPEEPPADVRALLSGPQWVPSRPFTIYDFGAIEELGQALREVDPSLGQDPTPLTFQSAEGMFLRLNHLIASNRLTLLEPAAIAAFLGRSGGKGTSLRITLYSPRPETTSKDVAIDRVEISTDGFTDQMDDSTTVSLAFGGSGSDAGGTNSGSASIPLLGGRQNIGQIVGISSQRRATLRFGTAKEGADGSGLTGHRARAVAVVEVHGPSGSRWVVGDLLFRTTETLSIHAEDTEETRATEATERLSETESAAGAVPVENQAETGPPATTQPTGPRPLSPRPEEPEEVPGEEQEHAERSATEPADAEQPGERVHRFGRGSGGPAAHASPDPAPTPQPSPAESLRVYLADALAADLGRAPGERRFWPAVGMPADATDDERRAFIAALTSPVATGEADDRSLAAAAAVFGLRVIYVAADGHTVEFGPPSGPVVVARPLAFGS
ncbi:hypothetical protein NE235_32910 [Actinoallomurus spadix]|uniref:hypothetical protein n=1 Tax=Actinoallomurus spadix TaxID=79912 RepID=UPI00209234B1|nr:hypothetical protein [Actinoallomurus spadix]MCO5990922.1 hypothetical protein [Actinoallomurus spadix]